MEKTVRLLAAAGVLMLLAGAIFGFMRQWICAHGIPACVFLKNSAGRYLIRSLSATITGSISPRPRPTGTFISGRRSTRPGCCGQHSDGQKNGAAAK